MKEAEEYKHLLWHEKGREKTGGFGIFDIYKTRRYSEDGREGNFYLLDLPDWVTVVPILERDGREFFLMVRQFRHGSGKITLEFPAGTIERGEDPAFSAARELLEETGYQAGELIPAGSVNPNPAFMNNLNHTFIARNLVKVADQNLDHYESLDVVPVPRQEVIDNMGTDPYGNGVMIIALWWYDKLRSKEGLP